MNFTSAISAETAIRKNIFGPGIGKLSMSEAKVWPASIYTTLSRDWPITFEAAKDWNPSSTVGSITYHWSTTVSPWWDGGVF